MSEKKEKKKKRTNKSIHFDPNAPISERFKNGLKEKYDLDIKDLQNGKWVYAGGNTEHHLNYFVMVYGDDYEYGAREDFCLCGSPTPVNSCYIYNKVEDSWIILGNCCIQRFLPTSYARRTCSKCGGPHKNRKNNLCNSCRPAKKRITCQKCGEPHRKNKYNLCNDCRYVTCTNIIGKKGGKRVMCGNNKKSGFLLCYKCHTAALKVINQTRD